MEDEIGRKTASPSLRRRPPVETQHRASPALGARKVFFGGYCTQYGEGTVEPKRELPRDPPREETIYSQVRNVQSRELIHSPSGGEIRQNVTNLEISGQNTVRQGILKTSKNVFPPQFSTPKLLVSVTSAQENNPLNVTSTVHHGHHFSEVDYDYGSSLSTANPFGDRNSSVRSPVRNRPGDIDRSRSQSVDDLGPANNDTIRRVNWEARECSRTPSGQISSTESAWAGTKLAGRVNDNRANGIKTYWEQNCRKEEEDKIEEATRNRSKTYGFPKWRSSDALSASLVASNKVEIPTDSRIPEQRLQKMEQTEKEANTTRLIIQEQATPKRLSKGKSLESLTMQLDYSPWYDRTKIREAISRESIANIGMMRERFESGSVINSRAPSTTPNSRFQTPVPIGNDKRVVGNGGGIRQSELSFQPDPSSFPVNGGSHTQLNIVGRVNGTSNGIQHSQTRDLHHHREQSYPPQHQNSFSNVPNGISHHSQYNAVPAHSYSNPSSVGLNLNVEEQLLLLYLRQNAEMVASLGILIPDQIRSIMDDIPWRRVELRSTDEESHSYTPQAYSPNNRSVPGRYVKNPGAAQTNPPRFVKKNEVGRVPENRRPSMQETDGKTGESLIAAEIRQMREREDELRRSRSELGLPSLEESMDMSRHGQRGVAQIQLNPLRSAVSYDHLHQTPSETVQKTSSIDHLSRDDEFEYEQRRTDGKLESAPREYIGQRNNNFRPAYSATAYKLQRTEDQDVMIYGPPRRREPSVLQNRRFEQPQQ